MNGVVFRLVPPPNKDKGLVDPLNAVRASGVLHLFEEVDKTPKPDPTFRPYFPKGLAGIDFSKIKPKLRKPKVLGTRLQLVIPNRPYEKIEPLDDNLVKEALKFAGEAKKKKKKAKTTNPTTTSTSTKKKTTSKTTSTSSTAKQPPVKRQKK